MPDNAASQTLMASADTGGEAMSKFTLVIMAFSFAFAGVLKKMIGSLITLQLIVFLGVLKVMIPGNTVSFLKGLKNVATFNVFKETGRLNSVAFEFDPTQ